MGRTFFFLLKYCSTLTLVLLLSNCTSPKKRKIKTQDGEKSKIYSQNPPPDPYNKALKQAFSKFKSKSSRTIASASKFSYSSSLWDRLDNLKVLVFPVSHNLHRKEIHKHKEEKSLWGKVRRGSGQKYHKPITFKIKTLLEGSCKQLSRRATYFAKRYFSGHESLTSQSGKSCKVIEVRRERPRAWGKVVTRLKRDQRLAVRLYIDSDLRAYGVETDLAISQGRQMYRTSRQRLNPNEHVSPGLTIFPINLPNLGHKLDGSKWYKMSNNAILIPRDISVMAKIRKATSREYCKTGSHLVYKDSYGIRARVEWCEGDPWPTAIHTQNYFSILL